MENNDSSVEPNLVKPSSDQVPKPVSTESPSVVTADTQVPVTTANSDTPVPPAAPATPVVPETSTEQAAPATVYSTLPKRNLGRLLVIVAVLIVVGLAAVVVIRKYGQSKTDTQAITVVKKDVPIMNIGIQEPLPSSFYPNIDDSSIHQDIDGQIFEGLTTFVESTKIVPQLATSWSNPDSTTWIFKLRPNVTFHTGKVMTAADVKASLDSVLKTSYGQEYGSTIASVSVIDGLTVKIKTAAPDPILPNRLSLLWIYDTTSGKANDPINGTGPYTLKPGSSIKDSIDLVAYDKYYGGRPHVRETIYRTYLNNASVVTALKSHQLQFAELQQKSNADAVLRYDYNEYQVQIPEVKLLTLNTLRKNSPLANLAVRQALMEAINVPGLLQDLNAEGTPATQVIPSVIPGYNPTVVRPAFNVAKAKQDLASAGYPNGFSLQFTYFAAAQPLATVIQRQFAAVGVTLNMNQETDLTILAGIAYGGHTDMYYSSRYTSLVDGSDILSPFVRTHNYDNPQVDKLYDQASTTIDPAKHLAILQAASKLLASDVAGLPLYDVGTNYWVIDPSIVLHQNTLAIDTGSSIFDAYGK